MPTVIALRSFDHYGMRRRDEEFSVSDDHAKALERAGLVRPKQIPVELVPAKPAVSRPKGKAKK